MCDGEEKCSERKGECDVMQRRGSVVSVCTHSDLLR